MEIKNLQWKIELCQKCHSVSVLSQDGFWGCLKCRELPKESLSDCAFGACVYCGQPLIMLMEACLTCGNQPRPGQDCDR